MTGIRLTVFHFALTKRVTGWNLDSSFDERMPAEFRCITDKEQKERYEIVPVNFAIARL